MSPVWTVIAWGIAAAGFGLELFGDWLRDWRRQG
jgi:hypothetical protein